MALLWRDIVYGPVHSRRLGLSLGVNLLPLESKLCSFECIYCECGWSDGGEKRFNSRNDVSVALRKALHSIKPDVITFAGNGEPTLHPDFEAIIDDTLKIRDLLSPATKVSVLSNGTQLHRADTVRALLAVDNNIVKLDSAIDATARLIDNPCGEYSVARQIELMQQFGGKVTIQTLFLRGGYNGIVVDNTTEQEIEAWLEALRKIEPKSVMVYTLDRPTPAADLHKVSSEELDAIKARVRELSIEAV